MQSPVRVSTVRYKAPELLLGYHFYDYGIDALGGVMHPCRDSFRIRVHRCATPEEVFGSISQLWGRETIRSYCEKYGIVLPGEFRDPVAAAVKSRWEAAIALMPPNRRDRDAVDLVKRLLTVDHGERITARDALRHPFFAKCLR
jgi:casein kinase II subunit alpha